MIVCDDADFASVVPGGSMVCVHGGQGCAMQTRMLLPRSRYDEGVELISAAMAAFPYGDPSSDAVMMGPLVSAAPARPRARATSSKGQGGGGQARHRRRPPADLPKGWFVEPTLFVDVDNSMTIAQEEIFGPVLAVIPYEDDDDAVRIANESNYGLSGGVFSALRGAGHRDRPPHPDRLHRASTAACGTAPTRPTAATRTAGSAASAASRVSSSTSRPRRSPGPDLTLAGRRSGLGQADHSASSSSVVVRRATKARLCLSMDAWCSGGVPTRASVGMVTAKSSSAAPTATSGMARFVETPATTTSLDPDVAQHGEHLGAVHRGDALVPGQHEVVGPDADLGDDLDGGVRVAPRGRRRRGPHERRAAAGRPPAGQRQIGQVDDQDAGPAGPRGESTHGGQRRPGRLGQRGEHREVADHPALALDEEQRRGVGVAHVTIVDAGDDGAVTPRPPPP